MGFFQDNFIQPVINNGWFNPYNTIAYGIILLVGVVLVYKLLQRLNIEINWKFLLALMPFVFWAPATRAIRDFIYKGITSSGAPTNFFTDIGVNLGTVSSHATNHISSHLPIPGVPEAYGTIITYFVTPGSYLITFALALAVFLLSVGIDRGLTKNKPEKRSSYYWKIMFIIGMVILLGSFLVLPVATLNPLGLILPVALGSTAIFLVASWAIKKANIEKLKGIVNYTNSGILGAHFVDASATFFAISAFGYVEQHVVPRLFFSVLGPASFFVLKAVVVLAVLWAFDKYLENQRMKNFLKVAVIILGLAPGLRDTITLLLG